VQFKMTEIKMTYKKLGNTGLKVSRLCLGCMSFGDKKWREWMLPKEEGFKLIEAAWKAGINFYDTADMYSNGVSEEILGAAIKELGIPRDEIVIATKLFHEIIKPEPLNNNTTRIKNSIKENNKKLSRKHIFDACEASLKRLGTDYIDLYQIHRWDNDTPIEETMKALHDLVQMGKVRYIGASTMWAWQFAKAQRVAMLNHWTPFVSMQNLYNLVYREEEREMIPMCQDMGVGIIPWSPLARGFLARNDDEKDKTSREQGEKDRTSGWFDESSYAIRNAIHKIAEERKCGPVEIAIAWLLHKDAVTAPIIGVSKVEHLHANLRALNIKLTSTELQTLESLYKPRNILGWLQ